jgi:hypothetical protein
VYGYVDRMLGRLGGIELARERSLPLQEGREESDTSQRPTLSQGDDDSWLLLVPRTDP